MALLAVLLLGSGTPQIIQARPSIATIDASARARGNRRALAVAIGERIFRRVLPVQLLEIRASGMGARSYVGLRFSGDKFHAPVSAEILDRELVSVVFAAFSASSSVREVDCWIVVPILVKAGTDVSGDKALPTERNVLTLSVRRGETPAHVLARLVHRSGIYLDRRWAQSAIVGDGAHA